MFTRLTVSTPRARLAALAAGLWMIGAGSALADATELEAALKKLGLEKAGDYYLVAGDADARTKIEEARRAYKLARVAEQKKASTASVQDYQNYLKQLNAEIAQYRNEINAVNRQINAASRGRRGFSNSMVAEARAELTAYRNQLQLEMNQVSQTVAQLKNHPVTPQEKQRAEAEAKDMRDTFEKAVKDAREAVGATVKKYEELASNAEVKKALEQLGAGLKMKPKLGPSRGFATQVKVLEKFEHEIESPSPVAAAKRKRAGATKSLKSAKSATPPAESEFTKP